MGYLQISVCGYPFFMYKRNTLAAYPITSSFVNRKIPYFLKSPFAYKFVSYHRFDHPRNLYAGRKHRCNFPVFLSGQLTKLRLHGTDKNSLRSNSLSVPWHFVRFARVRKTMERFQRCCSSPRTDSVDCPNLGKIQIIKVAKGLFLEIRVFFYQNCLWLGWCNKVFLEQ